MLENIGKGTLRLTSDCPEINTTSLARLLPL
jgi:hypothetical protein